MKKKLLPFKILFGFLVVIMLCGFNRASASTVTVTFTAPSPATVVSGATFTISVTATTTYSGGMKNVVFTPPAGFGTAFTDNASPYSTTFVAPTTLGTYTYTAKGTDNNGATTTQTLTVTVVPPTPNESGGGTGCGYGSITLTASGGSPAGGTYNFYNAATGGTLEQSTTSATYQPAASGTYYVSYTSGTSTSSRSAGQTVTINAIPILSTAPTGSGLAFSYPFTGNTNDASSAGNNGAIYGGDVTPTADRFGNASSAYSFAATNSNGTNGYIYTTAAAVAGPTNFTINIWFNTTTAGGLLIGFGGTQNNGNSNTHDRKIYMTNSGQIVFGVYNNATDTICSPTTTNYADGNWHMATGILSSTAGLSLYIDGKEISANASYTLAQAFNGYWRIGEDNLNSWPGASTNYYYTGTLDDIAVYTSAITPSTIYTLYGAGCPAVCVNSPLVLQANSVTGATYAWTGPNSYTSNIQNPTVDPTASASDLGTYILTVTGSDGCTYSQKVMPQLYADPAPTFTATSSVAVNANATVTYTAPIVSGDTYSWNFAGGTPSTGTGSGPFSVKWTTMGAKTITLTETNANGCSTIYTQSVTVGGLNVTSANYAFSQNVSLNTSAITGGISTTLSNFPALVYIQENALIATGNCSNNIQFPTGSTTTNGYDFAFTMQGSTTELYYQVESYNSTTGALLVWVNVPTVTSTNTGLTFYFGSAAPGHTTAFTQATWASDYAAVYHFDEGALSTTTGYVKDATANGYNATQSSSGVTLGAGEVRSAAGITAATSAYVFKGAGSLTVSSGINIPNTFTLSAWVNLNKLGVDQKVMTNQTSSVGGYKLGVYSNGTSPSIPESETTGTVNRGYSPIAPAITATGAWHYLQSVFDGTKLVTYVDGGEYQVDPTTSNSSNSNPYYIGVGEGGNSLYFNGTISEARVSSLAKSSDWINAEYYNQTNPTTFTIASTTISAVLTGGLAVNAQNIGASIPYTWLGGSTDASNAANWTCTGAVTTTGTNTGTLNIEPPTDGSVSLIIPTSTNYPVLPAYGLTLPIYSMTLGASAQFYLNGNTLNVGCHVYNNGSPGGTISSGGSSSAVITPTSTGGLTFNGSGILSGQPQYFYGSTNSVVNLANLTEANVSSSGSLSITGGPVNLYNTFGTTSGNITIASSATVTLESSALGSASVSVVPSANNITGNVSTQRYITGGTGYRGYRFLSSPVNINGVITQTSSQANISLSYLTGGMITGGPTGTSGGFTLTTTNPLIYLFDETRAVNNTAYTQGENVGVNSISGNVVATLGPTAARVVTSNVSVPVGNAYLVYYVGNTASGDALTTTSPHNSTVTAVGYLNQGTIPVHVTNGVTSTLGMTFTPTSTTGATTAGIQQIGNPYASTIDLDVFYTDNNSSITNIIDEMEEPNDAFVSINASTNLSSSSLAGRYIVSGQGFYLHNKASGNTLTFYEHEKVSTQLTSSTTPPLLLNQASKSSQVVAAVAPEAGYAGLHLKLMKDSVTNTETGIYFNSAWSDKYDPQEDAKDLDGTSVYLSSYSSDNQRLSLNELGDCSKGKLVNLFVSAASYGSYTLSLADIQNIDPLYHVYLRDHYLKDSVDLRQTNSYALNITSDTASYGANRFDLVIEIGALPPYKLLSFTGQKVTKGVQLNWMANNTGDYTGFVLQKEESNGTYSPIYTVQSSNISGYTYTDQNPVVGNNTYRLAQNDAYGNTTYSQPVTIGYSSVSSSGLFNVYPNPATNIINILVNSTPQTPLTYTADIYSTSGTSMEHRVLNTYTWTQDVSSYKEGVYIIVLKDTNGNVLAKSKFIKAE